MKRRSFLKGTLATGAAVLAANAGLLAPNTVMAAWNEKAFSAKKVDDSLSALYGSSATTDGGKIKFKAPAIAENGLVVPITVDASKMGNVDSISLFVESNPVPLVTNFKFSGAQGYVSTRIRMGKTSNVVAVVEAGGKLYKTAKEVKVTIGGCGG